MKRLVWRKCNSLVDVHEAFSRVGSVEVKFASLLSRAIQFATNVSYKSPKV